MGTTRKKQLSYRCKGSVDLVAHTEHWREFEYQAGPVQVTYTGAWGQLQVWASTEAEAQRVIDHVMAIAGWSAAEQDAGEWGVTTVSGARWGAPGTCRLRRHGRGFAVRTREGPDGPPLYIPYETNA